MICVTCSGADLRNLSAQLYRALNSPDIQGKGGSTRRCSGGAGLSYSSDYFRAKRRIVGVRSSKIAAARPFAFAHKLSSDLSGENHARRRWFCSGHTSSYPSGLAAKKTGDPTRNVTFLDGKSLVVAIMSDGLRIDDRANQATLLKDSHDAPLPSHCASPLASSLGMHPALCLARREKRHPNSAGTVDGIRYRAILTTNRCARFRHIP